MKIQPRQQLLEIWRATTRTSIQNGEWQWGGRDRSNSISDAEQLLCLLAPATEVAAFRLDRPDQTAEDVLGALRDFGDSVEIPRRIVRLLTEYMQRYTDESGTPVFSGGSYFVAPDPARPPTKEQLALDMVDSFSASVTLTLATIGFVRVFRTVVRRDDILAELAALESMASTRLTAAIIGLLRSFSIFVFDADSDEGRRLCRTVNQAGLPERRVLDELRESLREIRAGLRDVTIGVRRVEGLENPNRLFECGWSWGITKGAPQVETVEKIGEQREGVAQAAPYLYFTVLALDGIEDLFSERTRILGLLNDEQVRLSRLLQQRWDLTQQYWSTIASFGTGRWPLEDLPWQTTDGRESDYFSLLVTSVMVQDLPGRRASTADLGRVGLVLNELANRARITRRPFEKDPAVAMHSPGVAFELEGTEELGGPRLSWRASDFAPLLLRRATRIASLLPDTEARSRLLGLADQIWDHLVSRRIREGTARDLWDQPSGAFAGVAEHYQQASWYYTSRVVQCLVTAANIVGNRPLPSELLSGIAKDLLSEAEHLFDQELLGGSTEAGPAMRGTLQEIQTNLRRARTIISDRPGSAMVRVTEALLVLDRLAAAREDMGGAG
ncbi:MAG: hypothetical protein IRZ05_04930 [Micromonosporaceae bacterium]|jgi:hypothetical protein|nr:hypothetical protein [Micromonosporaceae bacterium]